MTQFAASRRRVAVVAGIRTPFARSGTSFEDVTAVELGGMAVKELVARHDVDGSTLDELIYGTVIPSVTRPNIAREVVFEAGLPMRVPASSVIMACASSNRAITDSAEKIALGLAHAIIAGGSECLSDVPILFSRQFAKRLVRLSRSKSVAARLKAFAGFRIGELAPNPPAIAEYTTELSMGQSAEKMAKENGIPFYVAAPFSTIDLATPDGTTIPIEQRSSREVTHFAGKLVTPAGVQVENPAFDVTPAKYVTAIITERGIARAPYSRSFAQLLEERAKVGT